MTEFDIFVIQFNLKCTSMDETIHGYIFGKRDGNIEYSFYVFPTNTNAKLPDYAETEFFVYKEKLMKIFNELIPNTPEIAERTNRLLNYIREQFKKLGGTEHFSHRLSHLIENEQHDELLFEIKGLFENWVERSELHYHVQLYDFADFSKAMLGGVDLEEVEEQFLSYSNLTKMPEFYPLIDPIQGMTIDFFDVGDKMKCTILTYPDDDTKAKIVETFSDSFDDEGNLVKPIEATLVSKELLPGKKETYVLVKVELLENVFAYSIILKPLRLIQPDKEELNVMPPLEKENDPIPEGHGKKPKDKLKSPTQRKIMEKLSETAKMKFTDWLLIIVITGGSFAVVFIIMELLSKQ